MIIFLESLGCSRNQVDSEIMLGKLVAAGHQRTDDPGLAQVIIVNTCGFISTASEEAVDVILEMVEFKKSKSCQKLIATGCLAQRYKDDPNLLASLPEVDAFLGTAACEQIVDVVEGRQTTPLTLFPDPSQRRFQDPRTDRELISRGYAFIKVSEGCNRHCTYCIIPELRGIQRSRPVEDICAEASSLVAKGVKEIILTAENTTDYGQDLVGKTDLASCGSGQIKSDQIKPDQIESNGIGFDGVLSSLSDTLADQDENVWIRFLYTHPKTLGSEVIKIVQSNRNLCSYYDVPIQHAASTMLKRMGRPYSRKDLVELFELIRKLDPKASLRTTLIVGFPGETEEEFQTLLDFIKEVRFDHLGVFIYSDSEDLKSHGLKNHVPKELAEQRHDILMSAQAKISQELNERHVGEIYPVLVEESPEPGVYIGRTMFQAPEVDGMTFIYSQGLEIGTLEIGTMVRVRITDAYEYDIAGEVA
ncbi:MAG: ribosomal protein S12 methylthiotransferase RimO [Desulfobacteraceae bacterium 4572_89]|nr:MAG: ribosomal protein S12 methylthiotransferase RimO [Desulfobacteraceae bacterium 4572_89]